MWTYRARVIRVIDGDTLDLEVDLGFRVYHQVRVRLADVDAPEPRGDERERGLEAKAFVEEWAELLRHGSEWPLRIATAKVGKYGRWLASVQAPVLPASHRFLEVALRNAGFDKNSPGA